MLHFGSPDLCGSSRITHAHGSAHGMAQHGSAHLDEGHLNREEGGGETTERTATRAAAKPGPSRAPARRTATNPCMLSQDGQCSM